MTQAELRVFEESIMTAIPSNYWSATEAEAEDFLNEIRKLTYGKVKITSPDLPVIVFPITSSAPKEPKLHKKKIDEA